MATIPGAMLLCASSPYARRGALWDVFRRHYGKDNAEVAGFAALGAAFLRRAIGWEAAEAD